MYYQVRTIQYFTDSERCEKTPEPEWLGERLAQGNFVEELYKAAVEENVLICKIAFRYFP